MAELPAGTVSFLFTDIEGSTSLLKRLRDRYAEVLAEHDRILRAAIDANGGHVVDTQGDALFAAFPRATAAVSAAVASQRALASQQWPDGEIVRVRMGLHSGEPAAAGERYVGIGVHRAARISSAAHGSQVLLSGATRELVEDDLPGDVRIVDLGEFRLKDIDRPEHLYQLVVDGLQSEFPPPRTGTDDAATVALAETVGRRRLVRGRRSVVALATVGALVVAGIVVLAVHGGGSSHAGLVAADSVGFIGSRNGDVKSQVPVDQAPTAVAEGAGAVWAANAAAGTVSKIDPSTNTVQQTIDVGSSPSGIAVGGGGVWVANHDDDTISWINPDSNTVVKPIPVGAGPTAIAYGFGSVWVTNADDRTVTRIDAATGKVTKTIRTNAVGRGITVGGGSVWVTDEASRRVFGIDPSTNTITSTATVGAGPTGIAYGNGSLWVANSLDGTVSQVDATTLSQKSVVPVAGGPSDVSFANGTVWVSAEFGSRVVRIDPRRAVVVGSTAIGNRPEGLAPGDRGVWVAVQASGEGHRGGRLVSLDGPPASIDPATGGIQIGSSIDPVYPTLTAFRAAGGAAGTQIVPDLAAALPIPTAGGTGYTFHLRPGIRYSDGRPLRAADFKRALERALELNPNQFVTQPFANFDGAAGCIHHRRCDLSRSVIVQGPSTITFRLPAPDPRFFYDLLALIPVPPGTSLQDVGTRPVPSTGPYEVQSFVRGRLLTLVRNRYFHVWSAAAAPDGYPDEIVFRTPASPAAAVRAVRTGKADIVTEFTQTPDVQAFAARHPLQTHVDPQHSTVFAFLNVRRPPFDDVRVRRALNYAVDRQHAAMLYGADLARPTCQLVPPNVPGYRRYCPYTIAPDASGAWRAPDLARARALIRASGTRGEKVVVWTFSDFHSEGQYLVALLQRLGYRARLHYVPQASTYFAALAMNPRVQVGLFGWFGSVLAADTLDTLGCDAQPGTNPAHFCDVRIDRQVARLAKEEPADPAGTAPLAAEIDRELTDQAPWVPLFTPTLVDLTSARVGNYQDSNGAALLDQLWVR